MNWFRQHIPNRLVRLALVAGLAAVVVAAAGVVLAAVRDGGSAAVAPLTSATPASDVKERAAKARAKTKHENASTRRIRVGQTLSMTTLKPLKPKRRARERKLQSSAAGDRSWTLVASPANAKVTHDAGAPTFTPDVHGTYIFERPASEEHGAGAPPQRLALQVETTEKLLCVNTRVRPAGQAAGPPGMKVGDTPFLPTRTDDSLQVVVLDRATAGQPHDGTAPNSTFALNPDGYSAYGKLLASLNNSHLVLVSGVVPGPADKDQVWGPLEQLGAVDLPIPDGGSAFSLIGIPGISKGSAWQTADDLPEKSPPVGNACDDDTVGQPASNLSGWLTLDTTGVTYTYVSPDFVDFDTGAAAPSGQHKISVGNQTYTVPTGQYKGFHAVVLDRRTMCPKATPTTKCDPGEPLLNKGFGPEGGGLDAMNEALKPWTTNPEALLFLAPFEGTAMAGVVPSVDLITTLRAYGASPLAPGRSLGDSATYALVGGGLTAGLPDGSAKPIVAESFTGFKGGTGQIAGTLIRDRQNRFGPREASLTGDQLATLGEIVYGPRSDWPEASDSERAAFAYLSGKLGYPVGKGYPNGVRDQYTEWPTAASVPDPDNRLPETLCTTDRPATVEETACNTVLHELHNEFLEVKYVDTFLAMLKTAFTEVEGEDKGKDIITVVENDIKKQLTPPPAKTNLALTLIHFVLSIASVIPEVGEVFEVAGAELDLAESLSAGDDGSSADPMQAVYETGDELLAAADDAFGTAVDQIDAYQPLIVSDYAKLTLVGHRAATDKFNDGTDLPNPPWAMSNTDLAQARTGLEHALKQWLYPPLIDAGFPVWQIAIPSGDGNNKAGRTPVNYRCVNSTTSRTSHPFGNEPEQGWIELSNGHGNYNLALGGTKYDELDLQTGHHASVPDAPLLAEAFGALPDHVGLDPTWYFEHFFKRQLDTGTPLGLECWPKG